MKKFTLFTSTLFLLIGFAFSATKPELPVAANTNSIQLINNWSYATEKPKNSSVAFDERPRLNSFKPIKFSQFSHLENLIPSKNGILWLKTEFLVPIDFCQEDLTCYVSRISMNDQTWLNGIYIGGWGSFQNDSWDYKNKIRVYNIPSFLIHNGVTNTLFIRIYVNQKASLSKAPKIANTHSIHQQVLQESFINSISFMLLAAIFLFLSIYYLLNFIQIPKSKEYLYYALLVFFAAIYTSKFFVLEIPRLAISSLSNVTFHKVIIYAPIYILLFLASDYLSAVFKQTPPKVLYRIKFFFLLVPIVYIFESPDYITLLSRRNKLLLLTIPQIAYILYVFITAIYHKTNQLIPIALSLIPLLISGFFDSIVHFQLNRNTVPYLFNWGWETVLLLQAFILLTFHIKQDIQIKQLNRSLESKNFAVSNELNKLKESISENIKTQNKIYNTAVYVQKNSTPKEIITLNEWELAYSYKPSNKIKSTIYDFFITGNELQGLDLFDLCDNTISTALVGMLAKNSIQSCFHNEALIPLHTIMQQINESVTFNNEVIKNSITGILLRISGNKIEYANAGHPDILHRSGKTGKVRPVKLGNESIGGNSIGLSTKSSTYKSVAFTMKNKDMIFIYTNCLLESKNAKGEKFGLKRITRILSEYETRFPSEKLNIIESKFRHFCGKTPLIGELTMLIIQRNEEN